MKNFIGFHQKIQFSSGFTKSQYIGGNCLKRVAWTVCSFKGVGAWQKRGEGVFEGVDTPMHTIMHLGK